MPRKTKNQIAHEMYDGEDFDDLYGGEKAAVTRAYNKQGVSAPARTPTGALKAMVGRIGDNGVTTCLVEKGTTVEELIEQSGFEIDEDKEGVVTQPNGSSVELDDEVKNGEIYILTPEIKSA